MSFRFGLVLTDIFVVIARGSVKLDFMCATVGYVSGSAKTEILIDEIAHDLPLRERLRSPPDLNSELEILQRTIAIRSKATERLAG